MKCDKWLKADSASMTDMLNATWNERKRFFSNSQQTIGGC